GPGKAKNRPDGALNFKMRKLTEEPRQGRGIQAAGGGVFQQPASFARTSVQGFARFLYFDICSGYRLQAQAVSHFFRRNLCPEHPVPFSLSCKFCGMNYAKNHALRRKRKTQEAVTGNR
ncbi:hypothetical protein, partial [Simplicispira sedimenti]|uniref:hypothetical protein n=1 Tax=Simplicispira sedimenti TaxID=2919500 RepID=UPI001FAA6726